MELWIFTFFFWWCFFQHNQFEIWWVFVFLVDIVHADVLDHRNVKVNPSSVLCICTVQHAMLVHLSQNSADLDIASKDKKFNFELLQNSEKYYEYWGRTATVIDARPSTTTIQNDLSFEIFGKNIWISVRLDYFSHLKPKKLLRTWWWFL